MGVQSPVAPRSPQISSIPGLTGNIFTRRIAFLRWLPTSPVARSPLFHIPFFQLVLGWFVSRHTHSGTTERVAEFQETSC